MTAEVREPVLISKVVLVVARGSDVAEYATERVVEEAEGVVKSAIMPRVRVRVYLNAWVEKSALTNRRESPRIAWESATFVVVVVDVVVSADIAAAIGCQKAIIAVRSYRRRTERRMCTKQADAVAEEPAEPDATQQRLPPTVAVPEARGPLEGWKLRTMTR